MLQQLFCQHEYRDLRAVLRFCFAKGTKSSVARTGPRGREERSRARSASHYATQRAAWEALKRADHEGEIY